MHTQPEHPTRLFRETQAARALVNGRAVRCEACGLPTRKPSYVTKESGFTKLRDKLVCQTCIANAKLD